jgi:FlgD Ig-like domain
MKRFVSLTLCFALVAFAGSALAASTGRTADRDMSEYNIAVEGDNVVLTSSTSNAALRFKEAAGPDTFAIFGYTDEPTQGKFQDVNGVVPDRQGWIGVDQTDLPVFWQISTFNADNLNGNGAGNNAAWSGQSAAQKPGWSNTPGYGNGWNDIIIFKSGPVANTAAGQTVALDFFFNYDTEPGYDFFSVEYDSAGTWVSLFSQSGSSADTNGVFQAPGVSFATAQNAHGFIYTGGDYGGANSDEVVARIRVSSDGGWSDEDGLWPTSGGAGQADDITITWSDGTNTENFEAGFSGMWLPDKSVFAGDFSKVLAKISDIDPCRENITPLMTFIDVGQIVNNSASSAQIPGYPIQTSGAISPNWSYGEAQGHVVNFDGGLSAGQVSLTNEVYSPEITWDLPGTADDGVDVSGAFIRWSNWTHLPLINGMFYVWHVRSTTDGVAWTSWQDRNFVYYGGGVATWANITQNVTDLLLQSPLKVQMALGVWDYASIFAFPGTDSTPSPAMDNAAFVKYKIQGPSFATRTIDTANDGFAVSGGLDVSTAAARGGLDIPFDMARDIATGNDPNNDPGDSVIADIVAVIPGSAITDMRMVWVLDKNPLFEDALRAAPARVKDQNVVAGATQWSGEVVHDTSTTSAGAIIDDRFFFDLPDVDLIYPGDKLRYFIQATDNGGRVTTLPGNTTGFATGAGYNRAYTVRGLPSYSDAAGTQPTKLILNDFGRRGGENEFLSAMGQLGFVEGVDYDTYTTQGPSSGVSNTIGSAGRHGATPDQLGGYDTILYLTGNLSTFILSDGSNVDNNDKADDIGVLTQWHSKPGIRNMAHFGDYIANGLNLPDGSAAGGIYVSTVLGVGLTDSDVRDEIDNQTTPTVRALDVNFATEFVAFGGCLGINQFDSITALAGAARGHGFVDLTNGVYPSIAASVIHDRVELGDRKVDMTFPYSLNFVYSKNAKAAGNTSARTELLREIFGFFGVASGGGNIVGAPAAKAISMAVYPNPFNPQTTVKFANLPEKANGSVKVYDLRGQLVATLHSGEFSKASFVWNGTDRNGVSVASGVYMIKGQADGFQQVVKVALVK